MYDTESSVYLKKISIQQLYHIMFEQMGPQGWWPGESKFEVAIGAILVQNTNWKNVEYSLANLRKATGLQPKKVHALSSIELQPLIRPSGFFKNKSRCIVALFNWLATANFDWEQLALQPVMTLRSQLLQLPGIGAETADSILLYCLDKPVFIADSYTRRIFSNLTARKFNNYAELKIMAEQTLTLSLAEFQEFHGLLDDFGKVNLKNWSASFLGSYQLILPKD